MTSQLGFRPTDVELVNRRSARLAGVLTTLAGLAIVVLSLSCAEDKASSTVPATTQPDSSRTQPGIIRVDVSADITSLSPLAQKIAVSLPAGWSLRSCGKCDAPQRCSGKTECEWLSFVHDKLESQNVAGSQAAFAIWLTPKTYAGRPLPSNRPQPGGAWLYGANKDRLMFAAASFRPKEEHWRKVENIFREKFGFQKTATKQTTPPAATQPGSSRTQPGIIHKIPDDRKVLVEADSLAKLIAKVKPDATWDDIKFLWAEKDKAGKLQFRLNEAYIYEPQGKKARWVLLSRTKGGSSGGYIRVVASLVKKIPVHDSGPGNYAIVLATDSKGGTLYQLGWESELGGAGGSYSDRQFYVLHDRQGRWRLVGQFPERSDGWREGNRCISTSYKTGKVEWTGDDKAPVRLRFRQAVTYFDGARYSEDEVNLPGLPSQTTYRDGVFECKLPAKVKWLAPR